MTTTNFRKITLSALAGVIMIFMMSACVSKTHFLTSAVVPAAQGTVQVHTNNNMNYVIKIKISNLSPSTRLTPPKNTYIVWLVTENNSAINLGRLNSDANFMSNDLDAVFETASGSRPVKIVITAEDDIEVQYPTFSEVILTTSIISINE